MTFIELIVVLSIVSIISAVTLFNFTDFSTKVSLQNLAQDIALKIKQAQTNAISGRLSEGFATGTPPSYGIHFQKDIPSKFVYFRDIGSPRNFVFDGGCATIGEPGSECLAITTIETSDTISDICSNDGECDYEDLSVTYVRPFPEPTIYGTKDGATSALISGAQVEIVSAKGVYMHIVVWPTGQISVKDGPVVECDGVDVC